jgi:NADH-quinone oxidoreductase subunit K
MPPATIPISWFLSVAAALFVIGTLGVIIRRNAIIALLSIELMLNAANLTLIAFGRARHDSGFHVLAFLVIATAAAEAAVGLAIIVGIFRNRHSVNLDGLTLMKL